MSSSSAEEQRAQLQVLLDEEFMEAGATWFPVSFKWWSVLSAFIALGEGTVSSGVPPSAMNNSDIQDESLPLALRKGVAENYDYKLVGPNTWAKLQEWYGGGPAFPRKVIMRGVQESVELFPQPCKVQLAGEDGQPSGEPTTILVPRGTAAPGVLDLCCEQLSKDAVAARLWIKSADDAGYSLVGADATMDLLAGNDASTELLVEVKSAGGLWPRVVDEASGASTAASGTAQEREDDPAGPDSEPEPAPEDDAGWREWLTVGKFCDAQDPYNSWFESVVREDNGASLKVHFMGWEDKWDVHIDRKSAKLQRHHSKVPNWRIFRANDKFEMRKDGKWYLGKVEKVDRPGKRVLLRPVNAAILKSLGEVWYDFMSDDIAKSPTHIKQLAPVVASYYSRGHTRGKPVAPGVVGLHNIGNTCFMNSMLQCLSNTEPLTNYFTSDKFLDELNVDNVLGCGGRLAEAYGQLVKDMWGFGPESYTQACPTELKAQVGAKAPQFQGFQQQDSQELMSFLMDGLHEDLNRVAVKPVVEAVESDGRPDAVVAALSWEAYEKRNRSAIVDIFGGQLKSHVTCNVCDRESTTFDPMFSLSVPLPVKTEKLLVITFLPYHGGVPA